MHTDIRKVYVTIEDVKSEGGKLVPKPFRMVSAAAVISNPWSYQEFADDLVPAIKMVAPELADVLIPAVLDHMPVTEIEAFGKAAVVGVSGEVEHGAALIHTLRFGNAFRQAVEGNAYLPFTNKRGGPGTSIQIPMMHKLKAEEGSRAHYLTSEVILPDAPAPDEIVVAIAAANGGRPHHRIGDRYSDMREMGITP